MRASVIADFAASAAVRVVGRYDLRNDPRAIDRIDDARRYPAFRSFLININSADTPYLTFGCKTSSAIEPEAAEAHVFTSRVDLAFLRDTNNLGPGPLTSAAQRLAQLLQRESDSVWADLRIAPAEFSATQQGYCLRLSLYARGTTARQAEVRWGLGLARLQQALLFLARELRR